MIDAILYINLEYRTDRKEHIEKELKKLSHITTNIHRIDGVLEQWCGHLGCGKGHVKALELAIKHNWNSVLIVEDDLQLVEDLSNLSRINTIEWDVMMLGHSHTCLKECAYEFLRKATSTTGAYAYIIRKHYYQTVLDNFKNAVEKMKLELEIHTEKNKDNMKKLHYCSAIDQTWFSLQDRDTFYTFHPSLAIHTGELGSDNNCEIYSQNALMSKLSSK